MKAKSFTAAPNPDAYRYVRIALWVLLILLAIGALPAWRTLQARFGPMSGSFSECQICGQYRDVETICGRRVKDEITTTDQSRWLSTFVPADHQHIWSTCSSSSRQDWFGGKLLACGGGSGVLTAIHAQRSKLSEEECRQLVEQYHELLRSPVDGEDRYKRINDFAKAVREDPESLLGK